MINYLEPISHLMAAQDVNSSHSLIRKLYVNG